MVALAASGSGGVLESGCLNLVRDRFLGLDGASIADSIYVYLVCVGPDGSHCS